ncbi:divalent-cation tolerance protein CutA [bacterium]|nr:divalent-cation tolerance protein CutA [bacterium]
MSRPLLGLVTCGSRAEARRLAAALLDARAAACVNILGGLESHYWWRGRQERAREWLLLIKTTPARRPAVTRIVRGAHSYDVPEIIYLAIAAGEQRYLQWIRSETTARPRRRKRH